MAESEVPVGGVSRIACLSERQRVHNWSLQIRMAHQTNPSQHLHNPQRDLECLDVSFLIFTPFLRSKKH